MKLYHQSDGALKLRLGYLIIQRYSLTLPSPSETSLGFLGDSLLCWSCHPGSPLCYNYNLIVIGGDPLFNGLPWRLDWLEGLALLENYDPALLRRIQRHIKFRIPDASMRRELFAFHLPNPDRVQADYAALAELSRGLSGGDILNVCVNAIYAGSAVADTSKWQVTQEMLKRDQEGEEGQGGALWGD